MKKLAFISTIFTALILAFSVSISALAPPSRDGVIFSGKISSEKKIALTFDDGPHPKKTPQILDILDDFGVRATFFIIGKNAENYPAVLKETAARGHEIANHTYSHRALSSLSRDAVREEIGRTDKIIADITGKAPRLFRPPMGAYSPAIVAAAREFGKTTVIWTVDTRDWAGETKSNIIKNIKANIRGGSIILFHDFTTGTANTGEALLEIIPYLQSEGYEFVTVSELLAGE